MRFILLLVAGAANAYIAPRRAPRLTQMRAAPEVSEQQSWMIDYMAKAHTARLEAVTRAKAEAAAEMEAKIQELEAQIAAAPAPAAPAPAAAPPKAAAPAAAPAAPALAVPASGAPIAVNAAYARRKGSKSVSARWGPEELARLDQLDTSAVAAAPAAPAAAPAAQVDAAYSRRTANTKKMSSRWGDSELNRI